VPSDVSLRFGAVVEVVVIDMGEDLGSLMSLFPEESPIIETVMKQLSEHRCGLAQEFTEMVDVESVYKPDVLLLFEFSVFRTLYVVA